MVGFLSQLITGVHHLVCRNHEGLIVQALGGEKLPGCQFSLQILKPDCLGRRVPTNTWSVAKPSFDEKMIRRCKVVPPSFKLVYKPINYRYIIYKP